MTIATIPTTDVDPYSHEVLEDPLPMQAALRDAGPVVYLNRYDVYALARHEQVQAVLRDWQSYQSGAGVGLANFRREPSWRPQSLLIEADPPRHDGPRRVVTDVMGPRVVRDLRAKWQSDAERLVDEMLAAGPEVDAVTALAEAFPLQVFPDAVGIGSEGREQLLPYGDFLFNVFGPHNDLVAEGMPIARQIDPYINEQCAREALTADGFGARIWAAADRGDITPEQAPLVVRSLLSAGIDTTVHGIAALLYAFATHPAQWERLRERPDLARVAFDEAIRWASPVQTFFRTATTDTEIAGTVIPSGEKVLTFLGAANRDPRRWDAPDEFDLSRDPSGHVGFGFGIHQCAGQHVARLEAESLLTALATRVKTIELTGPGRRHHNNTLRAWASLPIRFGS